jgi:hypothetical protein
MATQPNKAVNDDEVNACMPGWPLAGLFSLVEVRRLALAGCVAVGVIVRYLVGKVKVQRALTLG